MRGDQGAVSGGIRVTRNEYALERCEACGRLPEGVLSTWPRGGIGSSCTGDHGRRFTGSVCPSALLPGLS